MNVQTAGSKGDILVVDDTPTNLRLLSHMLAEQGYKVRSVINGPMALTATQAAPPDLILLDINMPGMNGYQVCAALKADEQTRDIPVLFISALDATQDKVKAFTLGGVDYITKPFQFEEVLARVETHLSLRQLQKQLQEANRKFEQELALAGRVQASFLPSPITPLPGWQLAVTLRPALETSGDFYDVNPLANPQEGGTPGKIGLLVADVVGKGVSAALYMALNWALIRTYAAQYPDHPERVCRAVNMRLIHDTHAEMFVTLFYGVLDPASGSLTYCNAAQTLPLLIRTHQGGALERLDSTGMPLGIFDDQEWGQRTVQLAPGDMLVMYTDGVIESHNAQRVMYGEERLVACVRANLGCSPQVVQEGILEDVRTFVGDALQFDDITLAVLVRDTA